ncbi:4Fe-4S dicluster domain-containing protein [Metallumcola ferriviriculae]|uniref:4Fe-4S dicluster domain-containing protein n=1 Tax=Metallumcola ferriviriculae TaxID=3039180 RepID=A0AAU0UNY1_9FIRM|nr:4Fe-4S dicluster domain-containing protein [Desulfitibacteraceae bacterium MK1]
MERINLSTTAAESRTLREQIKAHSGVDVKDCYQCGKCTAGCPVAFAMDYTPRQVIRLVQLGLKDEALKCHSIWLCACCETCYARCPRQVDLAKLMEALRIEAKGMGYIPEKNVDLFNDLFLKSVEKNGRVHEMGLILQYNLQSRQFLKDATLAPKLFTDGKIHIAAEKIADNGAVKRIFDKVRNMGEEVK